MRKRGRFGRRRHQNEDMVLQITSMADIFTIILVFLLKTLSMGIATVTPSNNVLLPEAQSKDEMSDSLKVEIGPEVILLDDKPVTLLRAFKFAKDDLEKDGTPRSLNSALIKERERRPAGMTVSAPSAQPESGDSNTTDKSSNPTKLLVMADQRAPYATVKTVMDAAAEHGFLDFKLVVVEDK